CLAGRRRCSPTNGIERVPVQAEYGDHRAAAGGGVTLHQAPSLVHQLQRRSLIQGARPAERSELAHTVARHRGYLGTGPKLLLDIGRSGQTGDDDGELGDVGARELFERPFRAQLTYGKATHTLGETEQQVS